MLFPAGSLDTLLFFTDKGKVYSERTFQIPEASRTARGLPLVNILALEPDETITAVTVVDDFDEASYCMMATRNGKIKRVQLSEFASVRPSGLIAINLAEGDTLGWAKLTTGDDEIVLVTANGQALRYSENEVRPMGRPAAGVKSINLKKGDYVTSMEVLSEGTDLLVVSAKGYGKRTPLEEYPTKGRATGGVLTIDRSRRDLTGQVVAARVVEDEDDLSLISTGGIILRTKVGQISQMGRATMGVRVMDLKDGDTVAAVARISDRLLTQIGAKDEGDEEEGEVAEDEA